MREDFFIRRNCLIKSSWLIAIMCALSPRLVQANPHGGTVAQGSATFNNSGSQLTITTSDQAYINWQSFNIGLGESTTFVQPSSSSLVWNHINDASPSQILGSLSANGYVVLQNQNGFYVGGQAAITAHGLIMTTAPIPMPNLSSGGAWNFSAPPPTATIVNYGQINVGQGGAYIIAHDIENHGSISASQGDIGLYAGQTVLLSQRPDGRGLSASVTLPAGSVDNSGKLIADAGTISLQAQVVNQGGLIQANSVRNVNGKIELIAGDSVNLGAGSVISAKGDSPGVSAGGSVVIKSGNTFSDASGSVIDVSGGVQGGAGGAVEISAETLAGFQSQVNGRALSGFAGGGLTIDPANITLNQTMVNSLNSQISGGLSQILLQADDSITMSANTTWTLADLPGAGSFTLSAGNDITFSTGSSISAGKNWDLNLFAGTAFVPSVAQPKPVSGSDGIYLNGSSFIQSQNGNINVQAANEVLVNSLLSTSGGNGIRTRAGGSINVTAQYGNVNTGENASAFTFGGLKGVTLSTSLGGISTAAGGDVNITAGGDVTSFLAENNVTTDAGSGAFGANPGNVTINAGGNVYGSFVVTHGRGTITAGGNIGDATKNVALSLVNGSWTLNAPNGNIYLQEVRNPNGIFNDSKAPNPGLYHFFDYDPQASVSLNAGIGVDLTGASLPRGSMGLPLGPILPPILDISAGSGGVTMENTFILFPSPFQDLDIATTAGGNFVSVQNVSLAANKFIMSDSASRQALSGTTFGSDDHGGAAQGANDPGTVTIDISGSMENINLLTTKQTDITVGGDMINCGFSGQNLRPGDVTSINVAGQIFNRSVYTFTFLDASIPNIPFTDLPPGVSPTWETVFTYAVDPNKIASLTVPNGLTPDQYLGFLSGQPGVYLFGSNPGFVYNPTTRRLGFDGTMSATVFAEMLKPITVLQFDPITGKPAVDASGHFKTDTLNPLVSSDSLSQIYYASHDPLYGANVDPGVDPNNLPTVGSPGSSAKAGQGLIIDGPGQFDIHAGSIDLGNTVGIVSEGFGRSSALVPLTKTGADIHITTDGDFDMLTSAVGSLYGGNITMNVGGSIDLGAPELATAAKQNVGTRGVFTSDGGNISVIANGDVNVDGSRIAAFNGGDIYVKSLTGNVDVGDGNSGALNFVTIYYVVNGVGFQSQQFIYGSGILASTLYDNLLPGSALVPGNITVETPRGDILSSLGGILQIALNHNFTPGPAITLTAGTPASGDFPGYVGNIDLGASGVIGGEINLTANGNIDGLVISRQNSTINAAQSFSGTVLSGGTANLSAGGAIVGTVVGVGGVNATGGSISATLLGQNVSANGAAAQSTLGTTATASSTSQAAANQSSTDTKDQVASNDTDDDKKKKKGDQPRLTHRTGRVTVILPQA